ncbi:MAG: hypothetical protein KJN90_02395 [Gammaproteobacteria bacterium]|nr:hypothetical protein [Gammaproteobacteria bacterium]
MKSRLFKFISTIFCSGFILAFANSAVAAEWDWAEEEIINSNFGQAAGWIIVEVTLEGLEETVVTDEDGNEAVCRDYLITVDKYRESNPQGRGKYREVTEVELETFCQPVEEEEV